MEHSFIEWFLAKGWKGYLLPLLGAVAGFVVLYVSIPDLIESPWLIMIGGPLIVLGFTVGIIAHMVQAYKISEK